MISRSSGESKVKNDSPTRGWLSLCQPRREVGQCPDLCQREQPPFLVALEIWDAEKQEAIVFLSNLLAFGATTIAAIYKDRWQVELFFTFAGS